MTTMAKLLANKQELLKRLEGDPGPNERQEIELLLAKINTALDLLDGPEGKDPP
jgi:hypothetical protein